MPRARILLVGSQSPAANDGIERFAAALSTALPEYRVDRATDVSDDTARAVIDDAEGEVACVVNTVPLENGGLSFARSVCEHDPSVPFVHVGTAPDESVPAGAIGTVTDVCFPDDSDDRAAVVETVRRHLEDTPAGTDSESEAETEDRGGSARGGGAAKRTGTVLEATFDGVFVLDGDGVVVDADDHGPALLGVDRTEAVGTQFDDLLGNVGVDGSPAAEGLEPTDGTSTDGPVEFEVTPADGRDRRRFEGRVVERPTGAGRVVALRDVTQRDEYRRELELLRQRYRRLVEQNIFGIYIIQDGLIRYANPKAAAIFGYDPEEMIDEMTAFDVVAESDHALLEENIRKRERGDRSELQYELTGVRKDGSRLVFEVHSAVIEYESEPALLGAIIDITERKQRQQRLTVLDRILRHNLRNDLNVVIGRIEDVARRLRSEGSADPDPLEKAAGTARDLVGLSRKVVRIQEALEHDGGEDHVIDAVDAVERVAQQYAADHPDATVRTDLPDAAPVEAGPALEFVIGNLVENAIEHNDGPHPTVEISIADRDRNRGEWYRISVRDDGPGIPDQERLAVEDDELTQVNHGSGVGLWGVVWIVQSYDGNVDVHTDDDGTLVTVDLRQGETSDPDDRQRDAGSGVADD